MSDEVVLARLTLPWPVSVNGYWRHVSGVTKLSSAGRKYREAVYYKLAEHGLLGLAWDFRLAAVVTYHFMRRGSFDIDNFAKGLLDALEHAGLFVDDSQIDVLVQCRGTVSPGKGYCTLIIGELDIVLSQLKLTHVIEPDRNGESG